MARNPPQIFTTDVPQVASMAILECNRTVKTMMVWFAYEVGSLLTTRIFITRPKPAYGRQGLDWIVRQEYSFRVFST